MSDSYDNNDCYSAAEFYQAYPTQGNRFVYLKVKYTKVSEGYTDDPNRYFKNTIVRNTSYYMPCEVYGNSFWTNDSNDYVEGGYWLHENHYIEPDSPSNDIIWAFTTYPRGYSQKCSSSIGTGSISVSQDYWFGDYNISFVGRFVRTRDVNGEVNLVKSVGVGNVYKKDAQDNITQRFTNTDNGGSGRGSDTHITETYSIEMTLLDVREGNETPYIFDVMMPTTHAWKRDEDVKWTEGRLLPQTLEWGKPYPYGKWYRDTDGMLKTRGLPDDLIDYQGAFNKCPNLVEVKIPETVKSIGRYSFRETNLKSVKIASDCTYYDTSFPNGCVINFY